MRINPLADIVVIRRSAPAEVSDGGVLLAYDPDFREDIGVVKFCGPKATVKPGDKVIFSTNGHQVTVVNMEELIVLREPSIIGVIVDHE